MNAEPQRELEELVDELLEQVRDLRRQHAELQALLLQEDDAGETPPDEEAAGAGSGSHQARDPIQLIAIEMAVSGSTREEVEVYLLKSYGVVADQAMLDSVFSRARQ